MDRTDAAQVTETHRAMQGKAVVVTLRPDSSDASSRAERTDGRLRFVRLDSTAWDEYGDVRRAVPTARVASLVTDDRARSVGKGALIGSGIGLALSGAILALPEPDDSLEALGNAFAVIALPPAGLIVGLVGGAAAGTRLEVVFVGGPPGHAE